MRAVSWLLGIVLGLIDGRAVLEAGVLPEGSGLMP